MHCSLSYQIYISILLDATSITWVWILPQLPEPYYMTLWAISILLNFSKLPWHMSNALNKTSPTTLHSFSSIKFDFIEWFILFYKRYMTANNLQSQHTYSLGNFKMILIFFYIFMRSLSSKFRPSSSNSFLNYYYYNLKFVIVLNITRKIIYDKLRWCGAAGMQLARLYPL